SRANGRPSRSRCRSSPRGCSPSSDATGATPPAFETARKVSRRARSQSQADSKLERRCWGQHERGRPAATGKEANAMTTQHDTHAGTPDQTIRHAIRDAVARAVAVVALAGVALIHVL